MNSPTPQDRPGMARMRRTIDPGLSGDTRAPAGAPKRKAIVRLASFALGSPLSGLFNDPALRP